MHHLPDAEQQVELHLRLALVEGMGERHFDQIATACDPLACAFAPAQEVDQVVDEFAIAEPQADAHGR